MRREVSAQGRSRAFLDGQLVTTAALREAVGSLIDLHGQHEHQALLDPACSSRCSIATASASAPPWPRRARLVETRDAWRASRRHTDASSASTCWVPHEIDKVSPQAGEDDALEAEKTVVANAEKLARLAVEAYGALYDDDHAAMTSLATVWKRLGELAALDQRFQPILDARESVMAPLDDAARTLRDYADSIDRSPERLQASFRGAEHLGRRLHLRGRFGPRRPRQIDTRTMRCGELARSAGDEALVALEQDARGAGEPIAPPRTPSPPPGARPRPPRQGAREGARRARHGRDALCARPARHRGGGRVGADRRRSTRAADLAERRRGPPAARAHRLGRRAVARDAGDEVAGLDRRPGQDADLRRGRRRHRRGGGRRRGRPAARPVGCQVLCITHLPQVAAFGDEHYRVEAGGRRADRDARRAPRRGGSRDGSRPYDGRAGEVQPAFAPGAGIARRTGKAKGESRP